MHQNYSNGKSNHQPKSTSSGAKPVSFVRISTSVQDGEGLIRKVLPKIDVEYDAKIKGILQSTMTDEQKFQEMEKRVIEMFNDIEETDVKDVLWDRPKVNHNDLQQIMDDWKEEHTEESSVRVIDPVNNKNKELEQRIVNLQNKYDDIVKKQYHGVDPMQMPDFVQPNKQLTEIKNSLDEARELYEKVAASIYKIKDVEGFWQYISPDTEIPSTGLFKNLEDGREMKFSLSAIEEIKDSDVPKSHLNLEPGDKVTIEKAADYKYEFANVQVDLPNELANKMVSWSKQNISQDIIYVDEEHGVPGIETEPHVTVKFGLHSHDPKQVEELMKDESPISLKLGKTSLFSTEEKPFDVLIIEVISPDLKRLNKKISDNLETTDSFPEYKPHATLAYLKKGEAEEYINLDILADEEIQVNNLIFSGNSGKTEIPLKSSESNASQHRLFTHEELKQAGQAWWNESKELIRQRLSSEYKILWSGDTLSSLVKQVKTERSLLANDIINDVLRSESQLDVKAYIRKTPNKNEWCAYSESGRNMGCYPSEAGAKKRLQQIEYFKHKGSHSTFLSFVDAINDAESVKTLHMIDKQIEDAHDDKALLNDEYNDIKQYLDESYIKLAAYSKYVRDSIKRGEADLDAGRTVAHEDVVKMLEKKASQRREYPCLVKEQDTDGSVIIHCPFAISKPEHKDHGSLFRRYDAHEEAEALKALATEVAPYSVQLVPGKTQVKITLDRMEKDYNKKAYVLDKLARNLDITKLTEYSYNMQVDEADAMLAVKKAEEFIKEKFSELNVEYSTCNYQPWPWDQTYETPGVERIEDSVFIDSPGWFSVPVPYQDTRLQDDNTKPINASSELKIAIDFDGTFNAAPEIFKKLAERLKDARLYLITGRSNIDKDEVMSLISLWKMPFNEVHFYPVAYFKEEIDENLIREVGKWKGTLMSELGIDLSFDDDSIQTEEIIKKNPNILVAKPIKANALEGYKLELVKGSKDKFNMIVK